MTRSLPQTDQLVNESPLSELGSVARDQLDTIFGLINTRFKVPGSLTLSGTTVTVSASEIETGPNGKKFSYPPLTGVDIRGLDGTFDLLTGVGTGDVQSVTLPTMTADYYILLGFEIRTDQKIYPIFGNEAALAADASLPAFSDGAYHLGMLILQSGSTGGQGDWTAGTDAQVSQFGAGGGGGGGSGLGMINYVQNYTADISADGWITYNDGAASPVDGEGGTVDPGFTLTRTETNPLRGKGSFLLTKPASNVQGHGVSTDLLPIPVQDRGRVLEISFDYEFAGTYDGDLRVYIYNKDATAIVTPYDLSIIDRGSGRVKMRFLSPSNAENLRLIFHTITPSTNAFAMKFDLVSVGPVFEVDSLTKEIRNTTTHSFSVGDVICHDGARWYLAQATPAGFRPKGRIGLVQNVIDSYSFVLVEYGFFELPASTGLSNNGDTYYLSETAGDFTNNPNQQIQVELFRSFNSGSGFWDPKQPKRLDTNPNIAFHTLRFLTGANMQFLGGAIRCDDGMPIYSSSSTVEAGNRNFALDLAAIVATPDDATTYWLYIDRYALGDPVTFTDTGRQALLAHSASHFKLLTTPPNEVDTYRFIEVATFRTATTGNSWTAAGSSFSNRVEKHHDTGLSLFAHPEQKEITLTTATTQTVSHGLSGKPNVVQAYYYDGSVEVPVDPASHVTNISSTQIAVSSVGLTFGSGEYLKVVAQYHPPAWNSVASPRTSFESPWYDSNAVTSVAHGLPDASFIRGLVVVEWDVTADNYRVLPQPSSPVTGFDGSNIAIDWTGFTPSSTLKYKIISGGHPLPTAIQKEIGGYTMFVGFGPGSYPDLYAALDTAVAGDSILVNRSESITLPITISVSGIRIKFMPNVKITVTSGAKGIIISGDDVDLEGACVVGDLSGAMTSGIEISGNGCNVTKAKVEANDAGVTITDAYKLLSGAKYNYINGYAVATVGTITNGLTDSSGEANNDYAIRF